jgi:hypothetical protein
MILLIEDRKQRLTQFEEKQGRKLKDLTKIKILDNTQIKSISDDIGKLDTSSIEVMIVHRSWLKDKDIYDEIIAVAKDKAIKIALFSGGIVQVNYHKMRDLELLSLPLNSLYSHNLIAYIENYDAESHLLELAYGSRYVLNQKLKSRKQEWVNQGENLQELNEYIKKQVYV